ncbi:MAG TPA: hypothetical protein VHS96_00885 [Bacteroidia bacterium]|nr:hypothetical protein [Bacteroidia bacterium]
MKTLNYTCWIKVTIAILCLHLSACEKEELAFKNVPEKILDTPDSHKAVDSDWRACGGTSTFFLQDESGNAVPFGHVPAGHVSISSTMDSLRLEIQMNAYWNFVDIAYKVSPDLACPADANWERLAFEKAQTHAEIRLARPQGTLASVQTVVHSQHFNLIGVTDHSSKLSIGRQSDTQRDRSILLPLPSNCDTTANVRTSSN